ncbi:MAG TPA: AAA family ATPase [Rubrobacteraceae bacterium]|nr:AAA family ATPase [Rubrobacteraceae bacterium]
MTATSALYQLPDELKAENSWVLWKKKRRNGKVTKVAYQVDHRQASSTDPATWTTFETAATAFERDGFFDGIGFVFHPESPYAGADIDDVTEERAQHWIDRFDSYTERSPSGNGFHIICKATVPTGTNREEGELYSSGRFFTMTGDVVRDAPVRDAQDAADEFYKYLRRDDEPPKERAAQTSPILTDAEVVRLAENAKHGDEFSAVYRGGGQFKSGSERDLSLASRIAFWTQDEGQIERIMRGSGCVRDKWDKHRTYLHDTIEKALSSLTETYRKPGEKFKTIGKDSPKSVGETERRARFERIDLGEPISSGMEPPDMLVPEELYAGRVHCIYSAGGTGKTFKALWLIKKAIDQGKPVLLLDLENGTRIISDRLRDLGAEAEQVRRYLYYYPFPSMPLTDDASAEFEELLEEIRPALVVVDSWINCLSAAGLDENSATDIAQWAEAYPQRARVRGIACLLLDHVPKEGGSARGSGRKLDYVDVMWELRNPQKFDRQTVGRIDMHLRKDREGWLPKVLTFSVGGGEEGFVFKQSAGTVEPIDEDGLSASERSTLEGLKVFGGAGAFDKDWREETLARGLSRATYYRCRETLMRLDFVEQVANKFLVKMPAKPRSHEVSKESHETDETTANGGGLMRSHPPKGETNETTHAETLKRHRVMGDFEDCMHGVMGGCEACR